LGGTNDDANGLQGLRARRGSRRRTMGAAAPQPRHSARATRAAGQNMRSRLLDAASTLFKIHGLNGTSVTEIAGAADAFPSQVTYYFRTKEALFVEAACRDILHIAERAEKVASRARTPKAYTESVIDTLIEADGLVLFVEALILARQRPDLIPEIARTIDRLHVEATRAHAEKMARHGWHTRHPSDVVARRFWTIALGTALEGYAVGRSATAMSKAMREALGVLGEARSAEPAPAAALRLVTTSGRSPTKPS
jgi:AcrR family transcriptional regulator